MAYKRHTHHPDCPYSGNFPIIEYKDLENLKESNTKLEKKLEEARQAPELKRDVFKELEQAEARVVELEKMLEESYYDERHNQNMNNQLRNTTMKIAKLTDDLDETNRRNNVLDQQVNEKKSLEDELNQAVAKIGSMTRNLQVAQDRSHSLEDNLREAKAREGELMSAKQKLRKMELELNAANRKLSRVQTDLEMANKKWEQAPEDLTRVLVNPGTSGKVVRSAYDGYGNKIKGTDKIMSIEDNRSVNETARSVDYRLGRVDEQILQKKLAQLKRDFTTHERKNMTIVKENQRLSDELRIMKEAFEKMQRLNSGKKQKYVIQDRRQRAI